MGRDDFDMVALQEELPDLNTHPHFIQNVVPEGLTGSRSDDGISSAPIFRLNNYRTGRLYLLGFYYKPKRENKRLKRPVLVEYNPVASTCRANICLCSHMASMEISLCLRNGTP